MHELTALEQAARIRSGDLSPVELVDHYLDRIDRHGPTVGAFIHVAHDHARDQAKSALRRVKDGDPAPLLGVPTGIKDLVGTADMPTSYGVAAFKDFVPPLDAHVARLMREAGTISLGKLNTAECGLTPYSDTVLGGMARTPWDLTRSAGGSSGGSAAAVAAGLLPFAHANDAAGSIRIPASVCGLVGFKPSRGVVSDGPAGIDPVGQLSQGPVARTVEDAAALLDAMAGIQADDLHAPAGFAGSYLQAARRDPGRLRIGRYRATGTDKASAHPDCLAAFDRTSRLLVSLGHEVEDIDPPFGPAMTDEFYTVWGVRSLRLPADAETEAGMRRMTRWWRARGRRTSGEDFLAALTALQLRGRQAMAIANRYDAVLSPTLALPPQPQDFFTSGTEEDELDRQLEFSPYAAVHNVTGQPSVSLPVHWTDDGLPIGVMLSGRIGADAELLALCAQIESADTWVGRRPTL